MAWIQLATENNHLIMERLHTILHNIISFSIEHGQVSELLFRGSEKGNFKNSMLRRAKVLN